MPGQVVTPSGTVQFVQDSSCILTAPELQVFASASQRTLPILAALWDGEESFDYGTKTQGKFVVRNPCVSLLGGSTTEWLVQSIPASAIGGGFTRRVNFVYAKDPLAKIAFPVRNGANTHFQALVEDLRQIATLQGEVKLADKSAEAEYEKYYNSCLASEFDSESVAAYRTTKAHHATKVAIALCAGEDDSLLLRKHHLERAIDAVDSVEASLENVFRSVGDSDLVAATDRVLRFIENKGYASRADVLRANWRHVSSSDLDIIITTLSQSGIIAEVTRGHKILYEVVVQNPITP